MQRPRSRGPLGRALAAPPWVGPGSGEERLSRLAHEALARADEVLDDDDIQVTLTMLYELHYTGLDGVDDDWEWDPALIGVRAILEDAFERRLRTLVPADPPADVAAPMFRRLNEVIDADDGPS